MLDLQNINLKFGDKVILQDVNLKVEPGTIVGLIGPNGAGKSSLLKVINQVFEQNSGVIFFNGEKKLGRLQQLGYIPEERGLYLNMTVKENLTFFAELKGMNKSKIPNSIQSCLAKLGLEKEIDSKVKTLSKGNQQKVQMITAFIHEPQLLILDEPFSGFDPVVENEIVLLLKELKAQGKSILLSTHRMDSVEDLCDSLYMINNSKIVLNGTIDEIKAQYYASKIVVHGIGDFSNASEVKRVGELKIALYKLKTNADLNETIKGILLENRVDKIETSSASMREIFLQKIGE